MKAGSRESSEHWKIWYSRGWNEDQGREQPNLRYSQRKRETEESQRLQHQGVSTQQTIGLMPQLPYVEVVAIRTYAITNTDLDKDKRGL